MTKKIFAISTLLLVLVIGAILAYNFLFKAPASQKDSADTAKTGEEGKLGETNSGQKEETKASIQAVSDEPVFGATLSPDGNYLYVFLAGNGQLNQLDFSRKTGKGSFHRKIREYQKRSSGTSRKTRRSSKRNLAPGSGEISLF